MTGVIAVFNRNRETYYDYANKRLDPVWPRYSIILFTSIALSLVGTIPHPNLISALISTLAILAGFSFSTQFFLVDHKFNIIVDPSSIEQRNRNEKISRIASEIFDNVSYFNIICVIGVVLCIVLLIEIDTKSWPFYLMGQNIGAKYFKIAPAIGMCALSAVTLEILLTFYRIIQRVNYLFQNLRT